MHMRLFVGLALARLFLAELLLVGVDAALQAAKPYGFIGMAIVIILRMVAIRSDAERRQRVYDLMENIEIEGGEVRPAVTKSPLPTVVALATTAA